MKDITDLIKKLKLKVCIYIHMIAIIDLNNKISGPVSSVDLKGLFLRCMNFSVEDLRIAVP